MPVCYLSTISLTRVHWWICLWKVFSYSQPRLGFGHRCHRLFAFGGTRMFKSNFRHVRMLLKKLGEQRTPLEELDLRCTPADEELKKRFRSSWSEITEGEINRGIISKLKRKKSRCKSVLVNSLVTHRCLLIWGLRVFSAVDVTIHEHDPGFMIQCSRRRLELCPGQAPTQSFNELNKIRFLVRFLMRFL